MQTRGGGIVMKKQDTQALKMKKLTLTAWAHILYRRGMIDAARLRRMIQLIDNVMDKHQHK